MICFPLRIDKIKKLHVDKISYDDIKNVAFIMDNIKKDLPNIIGENYMNILRGIFEPNYNFIDFTNYSTSLNNFITTYSDVMEDENKYRKLNEETQNLITGQVTNIKRDWNTQIDIIKNIINKINEQLLVQKSQPVKQISNIPSETIKKQIKGVGSPSKIKEDVFTQQTLGKEEIKKTDINTINWEINRLKIKIRELKEEKKTNPANKFILDNQILINKKEISKLENEVKYILQSVPSKGLISESASEVKLKPSVSARNIALTHKEFIFKPASSSKVSDPTSTAQNIASKYKNPMEIPIEKLEQSTQIPSGASPNINITIPKPKTKINPRVIMEQPKTSTLSDINITIPNPTKKITPHVIIEQSKTSTLSDINITVHKPTKKIAPHVIIEQPVTQEIIPSSTTVEIIDRFSGTYKIEPELNVITPEPKPSQALTIIEKEKVPQVNINIPNKPTQPSIETKLFAQAEREQLASTKHVIIEQPVTQEITPSSTASKIIDRFSGTYTIKPESNVITPEPKPSQALTIIEKEKVPQVNINIPNKPTQPSIETKLFAEAEQKQSASTKQLTIPKPKKSITINEINKMIKEILNDFSSITGDNQNKKMAISNITHKLLILNDTLENYDEKDNTLDISLKQDMTNKSIDEISDILKNYSRQLEEKIYRIHILLTNKQKLNDKIKILEDDIKSIQYDYSNHNIFNKHFDIINVHITKMKQDLQISIENHSTELQKDIDRLSADTQIYLELIELYLSKEYTKNIITEFENKLVEYNLYSNTSPDIKQIGDDLEKSFNIMVKEKEELKKDIVNHLNTKQTDNKNTQFYYYKLRELTTELDIMRKIITKKTNTDKGIMVKKDKNSLPRIPNNIGNEIIINNLDIANIGNIKKFIDKIDNNNIKKWNYYTIIYLKLIKIIDVMIRKEAKIYLFTKITGWNDNKSFFETSRIPKREKESLKHKEQEKITERKEGKEKREKGKEKEIGEATRPFSIPKIYIKEEEEEEEKEPKNMYDEFYEIVENTLGESGEPEIDDIIIDILTNKNIQNSLEGLRKIDEDLEKLFIKYREHNDFNRLFKNLLILQFNNFIKKMGVYCWGDFIDRFTLALNRKMENLS